MDQAFELREEPAPILGRSIRERKPERLSRLLRPELPKKEAQFKRFYPFNEVKIMSQIMVNAGEEIHCPFCKSAIARIRRDLHFSEKVECADIEPIGTWTLNEETPCVSPCCGEAWARSGHLFMKEGWRPPLPGPRAGAEGAI